MCDFSLFFIIFVSDVSVDHSSDVMACSTAAYDPILDVAAIIAERTSIWTSLAIASYMVFISFARAVCISPNIAAIYLIDFDSSCGTRPTTRAYNAHTCGS